MNRKIKFRTYDKERKEYLSAGKILISIEPGQRPAFGKQYLDVLQDPDKYVNRFVIEQFTGMLDKDGREIYEGDIILVRGTYSRVVLWDKVGIALMPCEYYHDKTFWVMNLQHPGEDWWKLFADEIEIIGNVHNNPELLKGEKQ